MEVCLEDTEHPETTDQEQIDWDLFRDRFISALGPFAPGFAREALARHAWLVREKNQGEPQPWPAREKKIKASPGSAGRRPAGAGPVGHGKSWNS